MKKFLTWFISGCVVIVIVVTSLLSFPSIRAKLQSNRLIYLRNTHRYADALRQSQQLILKYPDFAEQLSGFSSETFNRARFHYRDVRQSVLAESDVDSLLELSEDIQELAPRARKLRLELAATSKQPSDPGILEAARSILRHDGFDLDALWWVIRTQYRESSPLEIPTELKRFQGQIESVRITTAHPAAIRLAWLQALSAITVENWGLATNHFEKMESWGGKLPPYKMAYSHALIESGRPEAATWILNHFLRQYPRSTLSLQYLLKAWLKTGQYPWAAYSYRRLDKLNPSALEAAIDEIVEPFDKNEGDPLTRLSRLFRSPESPYFQDLDYWNWLMLITPPGPTRSDNIDALKNAVSSRHELVGSDPERLSMLIQYSIRENRGDLLETSAQAMQSTSHPLKYQYIESLNHVSKWTDRMGNGVQLSLPAGKKKLDLLLDHKSTGRRKLQIGNRPCFMIITAQGYDHEEYGAWPVVKLDLNTHGSNLVYLPDSRRNFKALVLPLNPKIDDTQNQIELKASLLNAGPGSNGQVGVYLGEVITF